MNKSNVLTPRETDVFRLMCKGYSNQEIADQLFMTVGTVKWYNRQIFNKLGVNTRTQATLHAQALGIGASPENEPGSDRFIHNLPAEITRFVGREQELKELDRLLTTSRLLTIAGPGGIGKTRLALELAKSQRQFAQHIYFVSLVSVTMPEHVVWTIAEAVHYQFYQGGAPQEQLLNYLRDKTMLLVLDNFEHLLASAKLVTDILHAAPQVQIIVTSRERLSVSGEVVYVLDGMTLPAVDQTSNLADNEAVTLFIQSAKQNSPQFAPSGDDLVVITHICHLLEGMPLGIELTAAWVNTLSLREIDGEIARDLGLLETELRDKPMGKQNIRAVFEHSWNLLNSTEQTAFRRLSVFRGGCTRMAAQQVSGMHLRTLQALVDKSLIRYSTHQERYEIHELLRQFGEQELASAGEMDATREQHSQYYLTSLQQWELRLKSPDVLATLAEIDADFDNVRVAWNWAVQQRHYDLLSSGLEGLYLFGFIRSRYRETVEIFQYTLDNLMPELGDTDTFMGRVLARRWGYLHFWYEMNLQSALEHINHALAIAAASNDLFETAFCQLMRGYVAIHMQQYQEALPFLQSSRSQFQRLNAAYYESWVLHRIGYIYGNLGDRQKSEEYTQKSLVLARHASNIVALANCLYNLGSEFILVGDFAEGAEYCREALAVATQVGQQGQIAHAASLLALVSFCQGDFDEAEQFAQQSLRINLEINMRIFLAYPLSVLILLECVRENHAKAVEYKNIGLPFVTNTMGYHLIYMALASLSCELNDPDTAQKYIQSEAALLKVEFAPFIAASLLAAAAYVYARNQQAERATELLALAHSHSARAPFWIARWSLLANLRTDLEQALGTTAFAHAWERGKSLQLEAAIADL